MHRMASYAQLFWSHAVPHGINDSVSILTSSVLVLDKASVFLTLILSSFYGVVFFLFCFVIIGVPHGINDSVSILTSSVLVLANVSVFLTLVLCSFCGVVFFLFFFVIFGVSGEFVNY